MNMVVGPEPIKSFLAIQAMSHGVFVVLKAERSYIPV